jgi:DNA invertase Pin-like site-specific DNA recombinase
MAELERNVIRGRVVAGIEYARRHGTKSGNAIGRPKRIFDRSEVVGLRASGLSIERIAHQMRLKKESTPTFGPGGTRPTINSSLTLVAANRGRPSAQWRSSPRLRLLSRAGSVR